MNKVLAIVVGGVLIASSAAALWKCEDPADPLRFVEDDDGKKAPPTCNMWVEIRTTRAQLDMELLTKKYPSANVFLDEAASAAGVDYPQTQFDQPVKTTTLYANPESFGFDVKNAAEAPPGSLVVLNGLGGILVETRPENGTWQKMILYPSKNHDYSLTLAGIHELGAAKFLVPEGAM